ncbi:MAG: YidC/Oxa1 family membrane protein insertase [Oscillospiraceae bacterium]|nr:YidC/Oxa1 family membrane protein insertase [Oscillospiraceae bacterium]
MWAIYRLVNNYAIAILLFTIVTRLLMFPLSVKQQKSMASTAAVQPKLDRIKKQYANNPNKQQEETMKIYTEEGINPMASCLPLAVQMILIYGVFDVVYKPLTHILRINKETLEALKTVAAPLFEGNRSFDARPELYLVQSVQQDPSFYVNGGISSNVVSSIANFDNKLLGFIDLGTIPKTVITDGFTFDAVSIGLILIPVIAALTQLATTIYSNIKQKKMNPEASAQMGGMNLMFYLFPIMSFFISLETVAGLGYYWICSAVVGIIQMVVLNKVYTPEYVAKLIEKDKAKKKTKKKSGLMERYQQLMQEQMAAQNGQTEPGSSIRTSGSSDENNENIKLSKSQMKDYERKIIAEARRRQAEKYGDDINDESE